MAKTLKFKKELRNAFKTFTLSGKGAFRIEHKQSSIESWVNVGDYFQKSFSSISSDKGVSRKKELEIG